MAIKFNKGDKFGKLTIADDTFAYAEADGGGNKRRYWRCICECGNETFVAATQIKNGHIQSCGCARKEPAKNRKDEIGNRYGKLTVLEYAATINGRSQWKCLCDCGNETIVQGAHLRNGNTSSCGICYRQSRGEEQVESLLIDNNISFSREVRFNTCKDKRTLPFDFGIYRNNNLICLIECQGSQHYYQTGWQDLDYVQHHDRIKINWCRENSIPLIHIPFSLYDKITLEDLLPETSKYIKKGE